MMIYIYIYPRGPRFPQGVGWGGACQRHVHGALMGGVGWGMLTSYSWYVDGWGGVGHDNVMFMVR